MLSLLIIPRRISLSADFTDGIALYLLHITCTFFAFASGPFGQAHRYKHTHKHTQDNLQRCLLANWNGSDVCLRSFCDCVYVSTLYLYGSVVVAVFISLELFVIFRMHTCTLFHLATRGWNAAFAMLMLRLLNVGPLKWATIFAAMPIYGGWMEDGSSTTAIRPRLYWIYFAEFLMAQLWFAFPPAFPAFPQPPTPFSLEPTCLGEVVVNPTSVSPRNVPYVISVAKLRQLRLPRSVAANFKWNWIPLTNHKEVEAGHWRPTPPSQVFTQWPG